MTKKNKKNKQFFKEEVVHDGNTGEVSLEPNLDEMVAGDEIAENDFEKEEINQQAMEFDYYKQQLDAERENLEMFKRMAQQLQADFDNYRKRNANIASESRKDGIFDAVNAMLPAYDALVEGLKMITDENTKKGLEMVERVFVQSLGDLGIRPIECLNQQFDPKFHNAILTEEKEDAESGTILQEFSKGFVSDDGAVVRVATVKIAK